MGSKALTPDARAALLAYRWPGNIRELANLMERAALLTDAPLVTADALGLSVAPGGAGSAREALPPTSSLRDAVGTVEREHLLAALRETDWNIARAAARLGIPRGTLRYRIEKLGLQRAGSPPMRAGPPVARTMPEPPPLPSAEPARDAWPWVRRQLAFLRATLVPESNRAAGSEIAGALQVLVEKAEIFGGRVEALGPLGMVAAFGLEAVEDAPRRAAHAAIAIRKAAERARPAAAERVRIKMAIHVSQGLVGQAGDSPTIDVAATGDAHAVLEPLMAAAEPDSILVTAAAARTLERRFAFVPVGPDDVTREPAYRLEDLERPGLALRGHMTPLVGRGAELEQLRHVLGRAAAGHGQLVAIVGEPGVGKSRLVWEVMQALRSEGWRIEHASAVSYGQAMPFQPVIGLVRGYFHVEDRDDPPAIREKVRGQLVTLDPALEGNLPALLALLDVSPEDSPWQALDPSQRRQRMLDAVKRLWLRMAQVQPLLLVVEDLHWVDAETQAWLDSLVESLRTAPLCVLVDYRPEYQHAWSSKTAYTQLRLDPLSPESAQELLRTLLGGDPGLERLTALLLERTEGNPFFLEEAVQALVETKALGGQRGAYALARPIDTIEVPATVEAVLAARIHRLGPNAKRLLQAAAVIGKDVALPLLLAIADAPEPEVRAALAHLQAAEFLYETRLVPDLEYTFKHALTHEVAYGGLLDDRRRALHVCITEALERIAPERAEHVERLAHHALRGELWEKGVVYLRQAGLRALARGANRDAIAHLEQALGALRHLPETRESTELTIDIHLDLRNALEPLDWARRGEPLHEAEGLARALGDQHRLARIATFMVDQYLSTGDYNAAVRFGQEALSLARTLGDRATEVVATTFLALTQNFRGEFSDAAALFERNVVALEGDLRNERFGTAWVHSAFSEANLAEAFSQLGRFDEAIEHGEVAVRISETADHPLTLSLGLFSLGLAHLRRGDLPRATLVLERCVDVARTWQFVIYAPLHAAALGAAYVLAGRAEEGLPLVAGAVEEFHGRRYDTKPALIPLCAGMAYLSAGPIDKARSHAREALALSRWLGARGSEAHALWLLGDVGSACSAEDAEGTIARRWPWPVNSACARSRPTATSASDRWLAGPATSERRARI